MFKRYEKTPEAQGEASGVSILNWHFESCLDSRLASRGRPDSVPASWPVNQADDGNNRIEGFRKCHWVFS